jgi:hypothetical protein
VLLKLVQSIDISSYFSSTPKTTKASKVSDQQNALKDSDSEVIAATPLVLMESVSDGNISEKETNEEKTTSLVETLGWI